MAGIQGAADHSPRCALPHQSALTPWIVQVMGIAPRSAVELSRDNLDENGGGNQGLKRRPVAKS
ncbi:MAG TPA: hypothetical protein VMS19_05000 [Methyloceanibacter sp.]|nr:hypothetical protein [Methyloceanibacter sp.]